MSQVCFYLCTFFPEVKSICYSVFQNDTFCHLLCHFTFPCHIFIFSLLSIGDNTITCSVNSSFIRQFFMFSNWVHSCLYADWFRPLRQIHPGFSFLIFHLLSLQESELDSHKQLDSPSEEEPSTPKATIISQNPKYQLYLNNDLKTNGFSGRDADGQGSGRGSIGENGPRMSRWETTRIGANHYKGSLECLASRDWDTMADRVGDSDHVFCLYICVWFKIAFRKIRWRLTSRVKASVIKQCPLLEELSF